VLEFYREIIHDHLIGEFLKDKRALWQAASTSSVRETTCPFFHLYYTISISFRNREYDDRTRTLPSLHRLGLSRERPLLLLIKNVCLPRDTINLSETELPKTTDISASQSFELPSPALLSVRSHVWSVYLEFDGENDTEFDTAGGFVGVVVWAVVWIGGVYCALDMSVGVLHYRICCACGKAMFAAVTRR
jgi:hypothetical protein